MSARFQGKLLTAALAGLALTAAAPHAALAQVPPPATANMWTSVPGNFNDPGSVLIPSTLTAQSPLGTVLTSVTINGLDGPSVSVDAGKDTAGLATLTYYFYVQGAQGATAPIDLTGTLQTSGPDVVGYAIAEISGAANAAACSGEFQECGLVNALNPTVDVNMVLHLPTNTLEHLTLTATADASLSSSFSASVDPLLTVDPSAGGGFQILVSPGVYNGPVAPAGGVPEPAAWALMILGFGVAGGSLRLARRRQALRLSPLWENSK